MRDTSDMMEDGLSEDTMMDCEGDGSSLEDLVDLATDIGDFSPTIQDAAKRLLTLLGVEEEEDVLSFSEDEGVEVDVDDTDEDEDDDEPENTKLLYQLAASLAQELKFAQQKHTTPISSRSSHSRLSFPEKNYSVQNMETGEEGNFASRSGQSSEDATGIRFYRETLPGRDEGNDLPRSKRPFVNVYENLENETRLVKPRTSCDVETSSLDDGRLRMDDGEEGFLDRREEFSSSWAAGWDACAAEALRYLVEDEGLPPYHPTILAIKNHLDSQRERSLPRYTA